jgi:acyl-CoA synthetase (AMP-forming)/AMP-acid ligase II
LPDDAIGEIAVAGPSVTPGVYGVGGVEPHRLTAGFLRTGDLGFLRAGELYVTGRKKDLIIVAGRNVHPQHIEWCVGDLADVRDGAAIAFSVAGRETERLVVVAECESPRVAGELASKIRQCVARELGLRVADVVVVRPFSLPKTSSGKLQRARAKALYLSDGLVPVTPRPSQA